MNQWLQMAITIICSVIASSGFWAYIMRRTDRKDIKTQVLIGLAHDRIIYLGMCYINRPNGGWITRDEYENLYEYLYKPYKSMGGNGSAEKIMKEIEKLPVRDSNYEIQNRI